MNAKVDQLKDMMSRLDNVGRFGKTDYDESKIYNICKEAIPLIQSLDKLDDTIRTKSLTDLKLTIEILKKVKVK